MRKNNHLIVVLFGILVISGLLYANISLKYNGIERIGTSSIHNDLLSVNNTLDSNNTDNITKEEDEEEISLGDDITNCSKTERYCPEGQSINTKSGNCQTCGRSLQKVCHSGVPQGSCSGTWTRSGQTGNPTGTCCTWEWKEGCTDTQAPSTRCVSCEKGYYKDGDKCSACKLLGLGASRDKVSPGTTWCIKGGSAKWNNNQCNNLTINYSPSSCVTPEKECQSKTIVGSYGGSHYSVTVYALKDWEEVEGSVFTKKPVNSENKDDADAWIGSNRAGETAEMEYGELVGYTIEPNGDVVYEYTNYHQRGNCGTSRVKTYSYCCVDNEYIGVSNNVKWADHKLKNNACEYYYGKGYTYVNANQAQCVKPTPVAERCQYSPTALKKAEEETSTCEESKTIEISEGEKCSDSDPSKTFYTIKCNRTAKTNFDYGDDGDTSTVRELYTGQGFKFGVNVESTIECRGEFNRDKWRNVYDLLVNKLKAVDGKLVTYCENYDYSGWDSYINNVLKPTKDTARRDIYKLWNIITELKDIVDNYNKYEPSISYDEAVNMEFNYLVNGKKITSQNQFDRNIISEGEYKASYENTVNLGVKGVTNPKNYLRSNKSNPRIVKLTAKHVYVNKTSGNVQTDAKNSLDGSKKIYIDYYTDTPQEITPINITVTGLAGNNSVVKNNKCTLKVKDSEIIYRPIDVSNPFINNTWTPGKNWVNSEFDFRNIIKANIWSTSGSYATYTSGKWNKTK